MPKELLDFIEGYLEDGSLEDLLEELDMSVPEIFEILYETGNLDEELLRDLSRTQPIDREGF